MAALKYHCLWFMLLLLGPVAVFGQFHDAEWLEQGLLAEFRGEYEEALNIWIDAREELDEPDSRIGFEFIRVATEQELSDRYEDATDMYYWALSAPFININRAAVRQEIERLRPIIGDGMYRQWINWFEERDETLASDIRGFWIQMDPTPGSQINERLIEHWNRIAYSRANFVKNRNTVYSTDDRALIYIRYGQPDDRYAGVFTLDNQNLGRWLSRQFESARPVDDPEETPPVQLEMNTNTEDENRSYEQLEEFVFQFHEFPEYEIWIYEPLSQTESQPLIFIFGTDVRTGDYHKQTSVDDFIPQRAFLSDRRNQSQTASTEFIRQGLTPALALQMLYYEQLIDVNTYFGERLSHIRESFIDQGPLAYQSLDLALRSQNREMLEMRINEAPREVSNLTRLLPSIPLEVYQYRLLDDNHNPVIISFVESKPVNALQRDLEINENPYSEAVNPNDSLAVESDDSMYDDYLLDHKLIIYDANWNEHERNEHSRIINRSVGELESVIQSVFTSEHEQQYFQSAAARLINRNEESITFYPSIFPKELRGLGTLKNRQPPPLEHNPGQLELGDLILGFYDDIPEDYPFNFRVANDQMIPADQSLMLHFEVYNLVPRPNGFTHFELTYRIYPVLEDGSVLTDEEAFYLTINFEHDETRVIEDLEIQTTQLSNGLYELQVMVEDMESGQERRRDIRFEVMN
jgi:GWxTD domain-containing protein